MPATKPMTKREWQRFASLLGATIIKIERSCACLGWEKYEAGADAWFSPEMAQAALRAIDRHTGRSIKKFNSLEARYGL